MRKFLFVAVAASALAMPAIAQVAPSGAGGQSTAQTGTSTAAGTPSTISAGTASGDDAIAPSNLGLGGLLQQTQSAGTGAGDKGVEPTQPDTRRVLDTKVHSKKAHGH